MELAISSGVVPGGHFANGSVGQMYGNCLRAHERIQFYGTAVREMQPTL